MRRTRLSPGDTTRLTLSVLIDINSFITVRREDNLNDVWNARRTPSTGFVLNPKLSQLHRLLLTQWMALSDSNLMFYAYKEILLQSFAINIYTLTLFHSHPNYAHSRLLSCTRYFALLECPISWLTCPSSMKRILKNQYHLNPRCLTRCFCWAPLDVFNSSLMSCVGALVDIPIGAIWRPMMNIFTVISSQQIS